jgi:hypothetical protein
LSRPGFPAPSRDPCLNTIVLFSKHQENCTRPIRFHNQLCVIKKTERNRVGRRQIKGIPLPAGAVPRRRPVADGQAIGMTRSRTTATASSISLARPSCLAPRASLPSSPSGASATRLAAGAQAVPREHAPLHSPCSEPVAIAQLQEASESSTPFFHFFLLNVTSAS